MVKLLPPLALIAGPTASGKSGLGIALAEATGGVIINADSVQLYRDLDVLSARPSPADLARAEHRLYGMLDGADPCSAARWADLARAEIAAVHRAGRLPILVGGTGLYLRTLLDGIALIPPIDPAIREEVRGASVADNRAALERLDPVAAARLGPADPTRIARALEVVRSTLRPIGEWHSAPSGGLSAEVRLRPLILLPPRAWLHERCDARFAAMVHGGAVAEVEALLARGLDPALPVMRAIGVRELAALVRGELTREEAIAAGAQATRRYAKRQCTWFSHQPPSDWPQVEAPLDEASISAALAMLGGSD